jgi:hypothetical protein
MRGPKLSQSATVSATVVTVVTVNPITFNIIAFNIDPCSSNMDSLTRHIAPLGFSLHEALQQLEADLEKVGEITPSEFGDDSEDELDLEELNADEPVSLISFFNYHSHNFLSFFLIRILRASAVAPVTLQLHLCWPLITPLIQPPHWTPATPL